MKKGLLMVNTGNGKGKTTAALGMALRSAGHGLKVCFIQFIKGSWKYGELAAMKNFAGTIDFQVAGRGFTWKSDDPEKDKAMAREAWERARAVIASEAYHLVVLDEFTYLLNLGMIDAKAAIRDLANRPASRHILITGRDAPESLLEIADLVTEMREVKHPFKGGITAQKGIEF